MSLAASYLELLQKNHLSLLGTHGAFDAGSPVYDWVAADFAKQDRQLAGRLRGVLKQRLAKAAADRPSRYQDPSTYSILTSLATHVEEAATAAGIDLPPRTVFGTLPLGQFNAMAIRVPRTEEHIIVFQDGVFGFLNLLSKAVSTCFPETDGGEGKISFSVHPADIDAHLDRNSEPIERLQQFLDAYVLKGHPDLAAPYILTGTHQAMAAMMLDSAELFVMGHEYAHVIQGHLNQEHIPHEGLEGDIEVASHPLVQELEADILGLKLSVESMVQKHRVDASLASLASTSSFRLLS